MELIKIDDLHVEFDTDVGLVKALNGIDLSVKEGETLGLVGETGAGKTTLAKTILKLIPIPPGRITGGEILYQGKNIVNFSEKEMRRIRGKEISMIFQDPMTSLNPVLTIGEQILEVIEVHNKFNAKKAHERAIEMLKLVGISSDRFNEYPHQFSGGMKQRVIIAIALACSPNLLIADEPTSALDVTIQAQVLKMMMDLKDKFRTSMILITHDLGVVAQNCDNIAVIYAGEIVEKGTVEEVFKNMQHPYTYSLFQSIPKLNEDVKRLKSIRGLMPDPTDLPEGCCFSPRCPYATEKCRREHPPYFSFIEEHKFKCFYPSSWKEEKNEEF